jgi:hypothetical protein
MDNIWLSEILESASSIICFDFASTQDYPISFAANIKDSQVLILFLNTLNFFNELFAPFCNTEYIYNIYCGKTSRQ